jgi:tetratricopeptide (TPR) repeat protein
MWDDVVESNVAARRVVNEELAAKGRPHYSCGHYTEWLQYAYLQQGKHEQAVVLLEDCAREGAAALTWMRAHPGEGFLAQKKPEGLQARLEWSLMMMRAFAMLEAGEFSARAAAVAAPLERLQRDAAWGRFADGLVKVGARDFAAARADLAAVREQAAAPAEANDNGRTAAYLSVMAKMLDGAIAAGEGRSEEGLKLVTTAAEEFDGIPFDFGPPATIKPPRELLGEMLLAAGRKDEARVEFERALKSAPERRPSAVGRDAASSTQ